MGARDVLGHIDCPACGTPGGMRITHDKNGEPFGYCEASCNQQLRIGGSRYRVAQFVARYPWAGGPSVTVTAPVVPEVVATVEPVATEKDQPAAPKPAAVPSPFAAALKMLGA